MGEPLDALGLLRGTPLAVCNTLSRRISLRRRVGHKLLRREGTWKEPRKELASKMVRLDARKSQSNLKFFLNP